MSLANLLAFDPAEISEHNRAVDEHDALIDAWIADGAPSPAELARRAYGATALASSPEVAPVAAPAGEWLTVKEVAAIFRWAPKTVRGDIGEDRLIASGGDGRPYRIRKSDAEAWAAERRKPRQRRRTRSARSARSGQRQHAPTFKELVQ